MREKPSVSSFEPRRLREANARLSTIEKSLRVSDETKGKSESSASPKKKPGRFARWWRVLLGVS
ncbi:hypothetical protein [Nitratifractor sp.]